ncbi:MAG TPA: hypothetical protein VGM62_07115 [Chthoniobacterales bacterium]
MNPLSQRESQPALSVLIAAPDTFDTWRKTIDALNEQTVRDQVEIVIVAARREGLGLDDSLLKEFHSYQVIEVGPFQSIAKPRAVGVRAARAPVVVFAEDHAYPAAGWGAALIEAHRQSWAAVGPMIINANPQTTISRVDIFLCYGPFVEPAQSGVVSSVPGDNSSYKRAVLLEYGKCLQAMLEDEGALHCDLRAKGYQLYLETKAQTRHLNFTRMSAWLSLRYHGGRVYGARRMEQNHWSLLRRAIYIAASPLFPLIQLWPLLGDIRKSGRQRELLPRAIPEIAAALLAGVIGEVVAYAFGRGDSLEKLTALRFHRNTHAPSD